MYKSNRERTRDLLLEYDTRIMPPRPRAAGIGMIYPWLSSNWVDGGWVTLPIPDTEEFSSVYPWESIGLSYLGDQIYLLAAQSGYTGTREEFHHYFGSYLETNRWEILFEEFRNFPDIGEQDKLYFDLDEKILYYWNGSNYTPVNAMLIANTVINGGEF